MPTCRPDRATGALASLAIQEESCWGEIAEESTPSVPQEALGLEFVSETLQNAINNVESQLIRSDRMRSAPQQGNHRPGGDITGELQPHGPWPLIFKHLLGGAVSSSGSGPYVHSVAGGLALPEGLTIEKKLAFPGGTSKYLIYTGCRVREAEIQIASEGVVQAISRYTAKRELPRDTPMNAAPSYAADNEPFNSFQGAILLDQDGTGSRTPIATISSLTLRIANTIDEDQFAIDGTPYRADAPEDQRAVNGDITAFFTSTNYQLYTRSLDNDSVSMELTLTRGSYSWHFTLPAIKLRLNTPQVSGRGPLNLEGTFEGFRDDVSGTDIELVMTNNDPTISTAA